MSDPTRIGPPYPGEGDAAHDGYPIPELTKEEIEEIEDIEELKLRKGVKPRPVMKPRLTVVDKVYFQSPGDDPVDASTSFSQEIESEEQPYSRKVTIKEGEEWKLLDFGWIGQTCSMMVLENKGQSPIEFRAFQLVLFDVPPGKSVRIPNLMFDAFSVRCPTGTTRYLITLFPK